MPKVSFHCLVAAICLTFSTAAFGVHAQTMAPDVTLNLQQPTVLAPTPVNLKGVTVQTQTVSLKRTFLEDFSNFQISIDDKSTTGWKTHFPFTDDKAWQGRNLPGNNEQQIYVDAKFTGATLAPLGLNPFTIYNKTLYVTSKRIPAWYSKYLTFPAADSAPKTFQYTSGLLTTYNTFSQTYGYFEFKATLPRENAAWAGMWMLPQSLKWPPEIDVMEIHNQPTRPVGQAINATHTGTGTNLVNSFCYVQIEPGAHIYGVLWTPETMTYYEDRKPICMFKTPDGLNEPMYLLLQLAIGQEVTTMSPDQMQLRVNWVAAYQIQ